VVKRDNFLGWQKEEALQDSWNLVKIRFRDDFGTKEAHYLCAHCEFISANRKYFEVDHVVSCREGGNANREVLERIATIQAELDKPLDKQDLGVLSLANLNAQVLCGGCNQAKKGKGPRPDYIPDGAGYAWLKRDEDQNPEHRYAGPPRVLGHIKPRYRKNLIG